MRRVSAGMKRSSFALLLTVLLTLLASAGPAQAAQKTCVPKGGKATWKSHGVRAYYITSKNYACSTKYGKRFRLEPAEFESDSFGGFQTNGRYLFYVRSFDGPTGSNGSIGRLLDLKTGQSTKKLGPKDIDYAATPECAPVEIDCGRAAWGAALGPGRSFVIGYWMTFTSSKDGTRLGEQFWVERHCFGPGLATRSSTVLDKVTSIEDLASLRSAGTTATWTNGGVKKSAPFC
jgi:hypothetical protein